MPSGSFSTSTWLMLLAVAFCSACASAGHLAEYEFNGRNLAAVTTAPPIPQVFTDDMWLPEGRAWWQTLVHVGTEIARDVQAEGARKKVEEASNNVDVAGLLSDQVLERSARLLRARPVESLEGADFEVETRVNEYGISASSWDGQASFFLNAEVLLIDSQSGRKIWDAQVDAKDPINPSRWWAGPNWGNLMTAGALARLSVEEIEVALKALADYSAERIADKLAEGLEEAGIR